MEGLAAGRIVRYVLAPPPGVPADGAFAPEERVAIITKVDNQDGLANLLVLGEGPYDAPADPRLMVVGHGVTGVFWATSISYSDAGQPQTWHWPERA